MTCTAGIQPALPATNSCSECAIDVLSPPAHGLSSASPRFIGRESELAALLKKLDHARAVTITGPGGVGKSRLAMEAARRVQSRPQSTESFSTPNVVLVGLEGIDDPALLPRAVGEALGLRPGIDVNGSIVRAIGEASTLVVLDGCDHLVGGMKELAGSLLSSCAGLRILATSQQILKIAGEHAFMLGPLAVPPLECSTLEAVLSYDAARLFVERARAACPDVSFADADAVMIGQICRALDGIPLALELAAPMTRVLSMGQLAASIEDGMELPDVHRTGPTRHRTMEAALAWSLRALEPGERRLLEDLSVFVGGVDLDALLKVSTEPDHSQRDVLQRLVCLVEKSFLSVELNDGTARYHMLSVLRRYLRSIVAKEERSQNLSRLHLSWCIEMVAEAEESLISGPHQAQWLARLTTEQANLRAALDFALAAGDAEGAGQLARGLWRFWELRGHLCEGRTCLELILSAGNLPVALRTHLLDGVGMIAWRQGDGPAAQAALTEALELARSCGDTHLAARICNHLGLVALFQGNLQAGKELFEESLAGLQRCDAPGEAALASANLALVAIEEGLFKRACEIIDSLLPIQVTIGDRHGRAISLLHRSIAAYFLGDRLCAIDEAKEAARELYRLGDDRSLAFCLLVLAAGLAVDRPELALELAGLAASLEDRLGVGLPLGWDSRVALALEPARRALGGKSEELMTIGAEMDPAVILMAVDAQVQQSEARLEDDHRAFVGCLGGFELMVAGKPIGLQPQVARLVKLAAAIGRPVHVEEAVEALWPEVAPDRGRRRLRNVLSRLHRVAGPILVREGQTLVFSQDVMVDCIRFDREARKVTAALSAGVAGSSMLSQARNAAALYTGELLPEEAYEPWVMSARERLLRRRLDLLDSWAAAGITEGKALEAEGCLRAAIEADPTDEGRYVSLARLLAASGRPAAALGVLAKARRMALGLGVAVSDPVAELEFSLKGAAEIT